MKYSNIIYARCHYDTETLSVPCIDVTESLPPEVYTPGYRKRKRFNVPGESLRNIEYPDYRQFHLERNLYSSVRAFVPKRLSRFRVPFSLRARKGNNPKTVKLPQRAAKIAGDAPKTAERKMCFVMLLERALTKQGFVATYFGIATLPHSIAYSVCETGIPVWYIGPTNSFISMDGI